MGPKPWQPQSDEWFISRLDELINMRNPLVKLAALVEWADRAHLGGLVHFCAWPARLAATADCRHAVPAAHLNASDEAVVDTRVENPYWRFFWGETYLQNEAPIDPYSLTRLRKRVGEKGVETLLAASIEAARRGGVVQRSSSQQVIVDTTVMHKAIAHPTDSRLLNKSRQHLVKAAEDNELRLRQNYNRVALRLAAQIGRYANAKQFKRMRKARCARCAPVLTACIARWPTP